MRKNVLLKVSSSGVTGVLRKFAALRGGLQKTGGAGAEASAKMKKGFGDVKQEAKALATAITAMFTAAFAAANKAAKEFQEFETGLLRANRMLKFGQGELDIFSGRVRSLVDGPLGSVPGLLENATGAVYDYISALGETSNQDAIFRDLEAAARAAAVSGADLNQMMKNGVGIASVAGIAHGELAAVFDVLAVTEQYARGSLDEVTEGVMKAIGPVNAFGGDIQTAAAAVAQLTKTGRNATESATMLRMVLSKFEAEQREGGVFDQLGIQATDFVGIIEELSEKQLSFEEKQALFGTRYSGFMMKLIENSDGLRETYTALGDAQAVIANQFNAYAYSTLSETTRKTNELKREQIELGERLQEVAPFIQGLKTQLQIGIGELAEFVIKNKELAIGAVFAIKAVLTAFKASNPFGWLIAAVELAVGAVLGIISLFDSSAQAALDSTRETKQLVENQKASVDAAREQTRAQLESAEANKLSSETIQQLQADYEGLTRASHSLTEQIHRLSIAEAGLEAQVAIEAAAAEIGEGVGEDVIQRELELLKESVKTQEERNELTAAQVHLTNLLNTSNDESAKVQAAIVDFLVEQTGLTKEQAELYTEEVTSREEARDLLAAIDGILASSVTKEQEQAALIADQNKAEWERLGVLDATLMLKDKGADLSRDEAEAVYKSLQVRAAALEAERKILMIKARQAEMAGDAEGVVAAIKLAYDLANAYKELTGDIDTLKTALGTSVIPEMPDETTGGGEGAGEARRQEIVEELTFEYELKAQHERDLAELRMTLLRQHAAEEDKRRTDLIKSDDLTRKELAAKRIAAETALYRNLAGVFTRGIESGMVESALEFIKTLAMQILENAIVMALLSLGGGGGFSLAGLFGGTPFGGFFASGGYIPSTPGGQMIIAGEGGQGEYVIPEDLIADYAQFGVAAPAMAAAQVASQPPPSVNVSTPPVSIPPAQVTIQLDAQGLWAIVEQGRRIEARAQG